jgi:hypothetical protein
MSQGLRLQNIENLTSSKNTCKITSQPHSFLFENTVYFETLKGQIKVLPMRRLSLLLGLLSVCANLMADTLMTNAPTHNVKLIESFLTNYRILSQNDFFTTAYVVNPNEANSGNKTDTEFWVKGLTAPIGTIVQVLHKDKLLFDPKNQEILGIQLQAVGLATVIKSGDPLLIKMQDATSPIQNGDRILLRAPIARVLGSPKAAKKMINAQIIAVIPDKEEINKFDIVALNYGSEQEAQIGEMLLVIKPRFKKKASSEAPNAIQNIKLGELMVFYTTAKVSYALVVDTTTGLHILDRVKIPE